MSPRNWEFRLEDIAESLSLIFEYVAGMDFVSWSKDRKTIDAVVRNLEVVGEAATHIPEEIQERYPAIPWNSMKGMRNVLIHEYFGVDTDVLWQTIQDDLPALLTEIQMVLES